MKKLDLTLVKLMHKQQNAEEIMKSDSVHFIQGSVMSKGKPKNENNNKNAKKLKDAVPVTKTTTMKKPKDKWFKYRKKGHLK